jgi:hypothetical protein
MGHGMANLISTTFQGGEGEIIGETGNQRHSTFTCGHCNNLNVVKVKCRPEDLGGLCKVCMKLICPGCYKTGMCDPFEEKLKRSEERGIALRSYERCG